MSQLSPSDSEPDVAVVIASGGRGERAGREEPKQFRPIAGVPMLLRAIRPFAAHPLVREIVVVLPQECVASPPAWLIENSGDRLQLVAGGETRAESVATGLEALSRDCFVVLVHDGARPFVSTDTIDLVIAAAAKGKGAIAAVPLGDTLKRVSRETNRITGTIDRTGLWRAQTPQGFPLSILRDAVRKARKQSAGLANTDEAALVEAAGYEVTVVADEATNIKVTTPEDFVLAEAIALR